MAQGVVPRLPPTRAVAVELQIDGEAAGVFAQASGGMEIEVLSELHASDPVTRKRPGKVKYLDITLKRGHVGADSLLYAWVDAALEGKVERKSGSIIYLDREGNEVLRLNLFECWPTAFRIGAIPAPDGSRGVEEFTLACAGVERVVKSTPPRRLAPERRFQVEIDGIAVTGVTAVSSQLVLIQDARDGTVPAVDAGNFTLTLDPQAATGLHTWFAEVAKEKEIRKSITIVLRADRNGPGRRYTYHECWPCRWKAPELNSNSDKFIVEEIEFVVERVERR